VSVLLFYKIAITMLAVLGLSFVAEKISPRLAGLLSGYPIGTAIILHFYGLEYGTQFAANAAIFNLCGLLASQCFAYAYYRISLKTESVALPSLVALSAYLLAALVISQTAPDRNAAVAIAVIATALFCILMRTSRATVATVTRPWSLKLVAGRLVFTAVLVLTVTETANMVGTKWAGLFSAFPVALYPLVFLLHREHGPAPVRTILGNFPYGLWSVIAYALTVSFAYPGFGVFPGTAIGFAVATLVLLTINIRPMLIKYKRQAQEIQS